MATNPFAQFVDQPEVKENPFAKYAAPALKLVPATPVAAAAQPAAPVTPVTPSAVVPTPPAQTAPTVTGVTPPAAVPQRADALVGPASRLPPSLTAPAVTPVTPPPAAAAPGITPALAARVTAEEQRARDVDRNAILQKELATTKQKLQAGPPPALTPEQKQAYIERYRSDQNALEGELKLPKTNFAVAPPATPAVTPPATPPVVAASKPATAPVAPPVAVKPAPQKAVRPSPSPAPLSLAPPGGERKSLTSYPNPQLTGDQYLENLAKVKPADGKSVLQNVPPAQSFSMVTPEFVKKFEQTFADLPLEQRLAKLKTFTTPETPYAQRMAALQILERVNKENQRTPSRDATSELAKLIAQSAPVKAERGGGADQAPKPVAFPEATPHFADTQTPAEVARQNELMQIISGEGNALAKPNFKPATPDKNVNDLVADTAIALGLQAPVGFAQSAVGLADLVTGNLVGNGLQAMGVDFTLAQKTLDLYKSESLQQAKQRVGDAKGFTNAVIASIANPSATVDALLQSAPAMLASIAAARYFAIQLLRNAGLTAGSAEAAAFLSQPAVVSKLTLAGSAAAGAQAAGSIQERGREAGRDYLQTAPSALGAGVVTAGLGFLTSKIPGFADAEAKAATAGLGAAQRATLPAAAKAIGATTGKESLEEGTQSASEKAFSNLSLGKPIGEGVPEAAGQGVVAGGATGAGLRTFSSVADAIQANPPPASQTQRIEPTGTDNFPPALSGRTEPAGPVDIGTSPGRAEPAMTADELLKTAYPEPAGEVDLSVSPGRTDPEMTADELAEIVAPKVDKKAEPAEGQPYSQPFISNRRIVVIRDVNGVQVPFYISTGSGGKKDVPTGQWYPYFGNGEDGWFNKGSEEDINDFYGSPELKAVADQLNSSVGDIRDQMDTLPAAADVRVNPSADMNPVSLSGARTAEGNAQWRSNIVSALDRIKKGAAKPTDQAPDEEMVSLDEFAIPSVERESVTGVTPETPAPTVTPVTPTNRVEYVAEVRRQLGNLQPGDVLENDAGDVWTVDDVMRNKAGEITGFLPREKNPENGKREVIDLDGAGSILLPSSYTDLDGNKKMSEPGRVNRAQSENVGVTPVTPEAPTPEVAPEAPTVTPVTPKAKARPGARLAQAAYERNPFLTFLARNGLYHEKGKPNSQKSEFSPDRSIMVPGFGPVFKKTGMLPDVMVQSAIEDGYLPFGATDSELTDLIRRAVSGERIAPLYAEGVADEEMARRVEANREANQPEDPFAPLDDDQIASPESAISNLRQEVSDLTQEAESLDIDVDAIKERTDTATQGGTESDYLQAVKAALADAIAGKPLLQTQTAEELRAKDELETTEAAKQANIKKAEEQRQQADAEVGQFTLTGSNRAADLAAAQGQKSIFEDTAPSSDQVEPKIGQVVLRKAAPENMEVQVFKTIDGYGFRLYDNDFQEVVRGSDIRYKGGDARAKAEAKAQEMLEKATPEKPAKEALIASRPYNQRAEATTPAQQTDIISSNNPVVAKGLNEVSQALPKAQKKLPPGRSPELAAAAQMVQNGTMTAKEYDALVNKYRPIPVYSAPLVPATADQVFNALDSGKQPRANPVIAAGTPVGLRLDIPAWNFHKTFVVSIHGQRPNNSSPGVSIGYASTAVIKNVTFAVGNQKEALKIAAGKGKDAIQTMEGTYVPMTPAETTQRATEAFKSGDWVQVGIDPMRHSYFFDRRTTLPVIKADEVLQIGNMILAKGVTFGSKDNFLYNLDTTKPASSTSDIRAEKIKEYAKLRARLNRVASTVAKGEVSIDVQRDTARLLELTKELKEDIGYLAEPSTTPARFLSKALAEYDAGNISPEVLAVVQAAYNKTPWLLDGLRLSVRAAPGRGANASFAPLSRIVSLYKETGGVEEPKSIRHELTHSLEQMMTVAQRKVVIDAWLKSMQRAIKNNPDQKHQTYFQAVMDHMENPTEKTRQAAIDIMPSYSMYQFINPSEFWAVNAESLMGQQLGAYWERFKKSMRTLLEGLKQVLGFDNRYAVHKTFNDIMSGSKARLTSSSLAEYVSQNQDSTTLLENKQDDEDLLKKHQQSHTPMLNTFGVLRNFALKTAAFTKDMFKTLVTDPKSIPDLVMTEADKSLTFARNKLLWFGTGLNDADRIKYGGELLTAQDMATASLALDNALRGGSIGVQVLFEGGIKFDSASQNFVAVKTPKGMTNVYKAQAELKKKLGDQLGEDIIQSYLEAKRSRSIKNEEYDREKAYELLKDELKNLKASRPAPDPKDIEELKLRVKEAAQDVNRIKAAVSKITMSDEAMDDFIALEAKHPELRTIMDNWGALNQNLLKLWLSVGLLSKGRYDVLSKIKDYVPWQRIMTDEEDIHSPIQTTNRTLTDIGKEKLFTLGKPRNIIDFVAEAGQQKFKIQPSSIVYVEINGDAVAPTDFTFTPSGEVTINVPIAEGDLVVFDTKREIENIIDNMTRNAMRMVMNGIRQYAALRIVKEYATRDEKNKIKVFPKEDQAKGRFNFIASGQRIVVEIKNPQIAEAIFGMEKMHLEAFKILAVAANFTRRTITLSGAFQIKQVFKDAPAAAFVTGVKNPAALLGGAYKGFVSSLFNTDPVVDILTQAGIGGFVSSARTPEADIKRRIGTINSNVFDKTLRVLDHIGDASDMAQRVAIYKQVMADTKDPAEALYRANNVINFRRHGSSTIAQLITRNVMFASAAAQSIDVLAQALTGGGLRGMKRKKALGRLLVAGTMLSTLTLLYCFAVGDDDDYEQMDDQTKLRNFMIPGTKILLPMNTGAAFFFKAIPELLYNKVMKQGTNTEMDMRRLKRALGEAARDMLLGPEPIPTGLRPIIEIAINHNFFTGRPVTPRGAEDLEKAEQYTASTSELAKMLGSEVLSPIEIDHLIRGLFGSAGAMAQWSSNVIGQATRPESTTKDLPIIGAFVRSEALRGREELFYDLAGEVKTKYKTWQAFMDRDEDEKADAYSDKNGDLVELMKYINQTEAELAKLNKDIKYYGETTDPGVTPKERREEIRDAQRDKNDLLEDVYEIRRDAGF